MHNVSPPSARRYIAMSWNVWSPVVCFASLFALAACGGSTVSPSQVTDARSAVRAAEEVGARNHPNAALHLQLAQEEIQRAEKLIDRDQGDAAKRALDRATVDAELAIALAKAERERQEANEAKEKVRKLKESRR